MKSKSIVLFLIVALALFLPAQFEGSTRQPVHASHGMVSSTRQVASQIGVDILKKGGNAVDAAIAVAFALAVTWPKAGNLGGGGFMLIRKADGMCEAIDYRETAPLAASRDMYLDAKGELIPDASVLGYRAGAVPGTVAGMWLAWQRYGKLPWKDLLEPARKLAAEGFAADALFTYYFDFHRAKLALFPDSKRIFLRNGDLYKEGDVFRQPDLAATIARIQTGGAREFYEGETARLIVQDMKNNGGLITAEDLKTYKPAIRKPVQGTYRGFTIITMPPPSSGGLILLEMLNMLELHDIAGLGFHSADQIHLTVEVMRRAFADRATLLGDTDFVNVPAEKLTSKEYARRLDQTIDLKKATPSSSLLSHAQQGPESNDTTHFSVIDSDGNIVSNTYTLNGTFGSAATLAGTGVLLNDEMDDFTSKPGAPNMYGLLQGELNAIAPRKRPLSAMTPTIILKSGLPYAVLGSPGGPTIINSVLQVTQNLIDFGMSLQQAVDAPRFHHQWMPDHIYLEPFGISPDTRKILEERGHKFSRDAFFDDTLYIGDIEAIFVDPQSGIRYGASDTRLGGYPAGY